MSAAVVLLNPKTPHNVGGVIRACSIFGVPTLRWTGQRVEDGRALPGATNIAKSKWRLPREERMKAYRDVDWAVDQDAVDSLIAAGHTPVCVEVDPTAEPLPYFVHPENALYIFGPEDSGVGVGVKTICHRFVTIPGKACLNLAAAVNVVLYDRQTKASVRADMRGLLAANSA